MDLCLNFFFCDNGPFVYPYANQHYSINYNHSFGESCSVLLLFRVTLDSLGALHFHPLVNFFSHCWGCDRITLKLGNNLQNCLPSHQYVYPFIYLDPLRFLSIWFFSKIISRYLIFYARVHGIILTISMFPTFRNATDF